MPSLDAAAGLLGKRHAAHLLRRSTFGVTRTLIESFALKTATQAVDELTAVTPVTTTPIDFKTNQTWVDNFQLPGINSDDFFLKHYVSGWWLNNALHDNTIHHKMILFNHQYWITTYESVTSEMYYDYLKLLEYYALGSYKTLAGKMTFDNSMLVYLNGTDNNKQSPNQNYAREFLELFTIGKGVQTGPGNYTNYTETDIQEAARILTGFKVRWNDNAFKDADTNIRCGIPEIVAHDIDNKIFSSAFDNTLIAGSNTDNGMRAELQDFIDMVFNKTETANAICRRIYTFFVSAHISPEVETDIILPLATELKNNNYVLLPTIKRLLASKHFYDMDSAIPGDEHIGGMIKSPLDLLLGTLRFFDIKPPDKLLHTEDHYEHFWKQTVIEFFLKGCGMPIFLPTNVSGYKPFYPVAGF